MSSNRIRELTSAIAASNAVIQDYLSAKNQAAPSFEDGIPLGLVRDEAPSAARQQMLEATEELHALMLGPIGPFIYPSHNFMISMQAICTWGLPTAVPLDNEVPFEDLASQCNLNTSTLKRVLRHAIARRIFKEPKAGYVAHNAASRLLAQDPGLRQWIGMVAGEMWPAATKAVEAVSQWPDSEEPNHCGFNLAHDTNLNEFEELHNHPSREKRYADAMGWYQSRPGFEVEHVVTSYDWEKLGFGTVVDVGGSLGSIDVALAREFPSLRLIVQDRPEVVEQGVGRLPQELRHRVAFMAHDFFSEQIVKNADVYFMRFILHDWSDKYAIKILKCLVPALKKGSRVLAQEHVLPAPGEMSAYNEQNMRGFDLSMMECHNGRERDLSEWMDLFGEADPKFKFLKSSRPPGSRLSLLEFRWTEEED